ncbi:MULTISPECIES: gas vesicle protein K [unclassified Nocardioides]|uniref:gas vesicle protein K n=1 Tax=unclassified Nocardioides TaxID=2615069 RepID=UPI00361A31CE
MSGMPWDDLADLGRAHDIGVAREPDRESGAPRRTLLPQRLETDREAVERDLLKLVLTIIELIRQLMEKQALRRVDEGDLTDEQIEGLGSGLMALEQAMEDLKDRYGLTTEDLNIDLGPLGTLLPE